VSLLPVFIAFGLGVAILIRREIGTAVLLLGILADEVFNDVLKTSIAEPRPQRSSDRGVWGEYGMPSSHAQFMWFFAAYMTLWTLRRLRPRPTTMCGPALTTAVKWLIVLALCVAALAVMWSRVYLGYHTVEQVACGAGVGAAAGAAW
jgi:dolichyldiphosphatase